jgi:hypothetical protein
VSQIILRDSDFDRYAGLWPTERFRAHDIAYEPAEKPKSDLYRDMLPLLNARRIELLDDRKLIRQPRAGRDSIDHMPGAHDDVCNAVAGGASLLAAESWYWKHNMAWVSDRKPEDLAAGIPLINPHLHISDQPS